MRQSELSDLARDYLRHKWHWHWLLAEDDCDERLADAAMARIEPHLTEGDIVLISLELNKLAPASAWSVSTH